MSKLSIDCGGLFWVSTTPTHQTSLLSDDILCFDLFNICSINLSMSAVCCWSYVDTDAGVIVAQQDDLRIYDWLFVLIIQSTERRGTAMFLRALHLPASDLSGYVIPKHSQIHSCEIELCLPKANLAKLCYTSSLGSNGEKRMIFWDQSQIDQLGSIGSIPRSCHAKPRPPPPIDLFDILIVLDQKEIVWIYKLFNPL